MIDLPKIGVETVKEFIKEVKEIVRNEKSLSVNGKKFPGDRYFIIVTQRGDAEAILHPEVNMKELYTVILKGLNPDQAEKIIEGVISLGIRIIKPLGYDSSIPLIELGTSEEFLKEIEIVVKVGRHTGREYILYVPRSRDPEAYLVPKRSKSIFPTIAIKNMNSDEADTIIAAGDKLGLQTKKPLYYLP